jgi:hypothetical protein
MPTSDQEQQPHDDDDDDATVVVPEGDRSAMLLQGRRPPLGSEQHGPQLVCTSDLSQALSTCQLATKNDDNDNDDDALCSLMKDIML